MLHILECFFNLEAVVVDPDNLVPAAGLVVGQNVPRFFGPAVLR